MSDTWSMPTRIVPFGDGYTERSSDGLNIANEVWDVECAFASETAGANLQTFLESVGGWKAFLWQSPRDLTAQAYVIVQPVGGSVRSGGGSKPYFFTRKLNFKKVPFLHTITSGTLINGLVGNTVGETVTGTSGNDTIYGNGGNDTIYGGTGNDSISAGGPGSTNAGFSTMYGDGGDDTLIGGSPSPGDGLSGYNYLTGTNDTLLGVGEHDTLIGGGIGSVNTFYLGGSNGSYYVGSGNADYASISNFDVNVDTIQLHGASSDYAQTFANGKVSLYRIGSGGSQDLIAQIDATGLFDLNDLFAFNYVS
jgi:phage-related protein